MLGDTSVKENLPIWRKAPKSAGECKEWRYPIRQSAIIKNTRSKNILPDPVIFTPEEMLRKPGSFYEKSRAMVNKAVSICMLLYNRQTFLLLFFQKKNGLSDTFSPSHADVQEENRPAHWSASRMASFTPQACAAEAWQGCGQVPTARLLHGGWEAVPVSCVASHLNLWCPWELMSLHCPLLSLVPAAEHHTQLFALGGGQTSKDVEDSGGFLAAWVFWPR